MQETSGDNNNKRKAMNRILPLSSSFVSIVSSSSIRFISSSQLSRLSPRVGKKAFYGPSCSLPHLLTLRRFCCCCCFSSYIFFYTPYFVSFVCVFFLLHSASSYILPNTTLLVSSSSFFFMQLHIIWINNICVCPFASLKERERRNTQKQ